MSLFTSLTSESLASAVNDLIKKNPLISDLTNKLNLVQTAITSASSDIKGAQDNILNQVQSVVQTTVQTEVAKAVGSVGTAEAIPPPDNTPLENAPPDNIPLENAPAENAPEEVGTAEQMGGGRSREKVYLDRPYSGQIYVTEVNKQQVYFIRLPNGEIQPLKTRARLTVPTRKGRAPKKAATRRR
jgi:hypothetical protein